MPNDRDEREEPRFKIIDRRMLSDEERTGKVSTPAPAEEKPAPKLEIVGGGVGSSALKEEPGEAVSAPSAFGDAADATETFDAEGFDTEGYEIAEDEAPLSEEEAEQMREQMEQEQFAALEQQFGRPLTDNEKDQVRSLMDRQAQSMTKLEVAPLLIQTVSELPRYAAVHLGLVPNPYTGIIARNDADARMAIDAFGALYEVLKPSIDARAAAELARVLNDLRTNYTRITGISVGPTGGPRIIR